MIKITEIRNKCNRPNTRSVFFVTDIIYKAHYTRDSKQRCYVGNCATKKTGKGLSGHKEE